MDLSVIIILVIVGLVVVAGVVFVIRLFVKAPKVITGVDPMIWDGPEGRTVDIPTRQLSRVAPGALSFVALGRYSGRSAVRLTPRTIYSLTLRKKEIPYDSVVEVEVPYPSQPEFVVLRYAGGTGLGVVAASWQAADALLLELSARCQLSPEAWQRIAPYRPGPPPPRSPRPGPPQQPPPRPW